MDFRYQCFWLLNRLRKLARIVRGKRSNEVEEDFARFQHAARFLCGHTFTTAANAPKALVAMATNKPFECKLLGMFALGLRIERWHVRILLFSRKDVVLRAYMEALGFHDFIYWSDFSLSSSEKATCEQHARLLLAQSLAFSAVKEWHYRDCWIGPNILASLSRRSYQGEPDPSSPENLHLLQKILPLCLQRIHIAEKVIAQLRPDLMYAIEPNYWQNGPITDVAIKSGVDFIHAAGSPQDDALMLRRLTGGNRRAHPSAITPQSFRAVCALPWGEQQEKELQHAFGERYSNKWVRQQLVVGNGRFFEEDQIREKLQIAPGKKIAVVFSHVLWDANLFYGEDLFDDYGHWFAETVKAACGNPRVEWLIKLHPANIYKRKRDQVKNTPLAEISLIEKHVGPLNQLPPYIHLLYPENEISAQSLFTLADYGVTVRGTVSTEMPCFGKPVLTAGTGRAHGHGFTTDSKTREEYLARLASLHELPPLSPEQVLLAKRHAHAIFLLRPWSMRTFTVTCDDLSDGKKTLSQNIHLKATSLQEVQDNGDLASWALFAANRDQTDYFNITLPPVS